MSIDTLYALGVMVTWLVLSAWAYTVLGCSRDEQHPSHHRLPHQ